MKTFKFSVFALAAIFSAVSCSKTEGLLPTDRQMETAVPCEYITLAASYEESETKTHIDTVGKALNVFWDSLDVISVYDNLSAGVSNEFSIKKESISGSSASFEGEASVGASTFWAVYPAGAASGISGDNLSVTVPNEQVLKNGVGSDVLPSVAKAAKGESLQFKNVCGILTVKVTYPNVTSIIVEGTNVAGTATVDATTGAITQVTDGQNQITVTSDSTEFMKGVYYIAVLPGVTEAGNFSITMVRKGGYSVKSTASKAFEVIRNSQSNFGELDTKLKWVFNITTKEELLAWNETASYDADEVHLKADIDLDGETWTPKAIKGLFDGENHKIYNVVCTQNGTQDGGRYLNGFFTTTNASTVVKDLILGSSDGTTYDGKSLVKLENTDRGSWCYAGGVVSTLNGGEINNVKSFSKVELGANDVKKAKIGGIAGAVVSANSKILNCTNYGEVVNNASASTATTSGNREPVGGITASCEDAAGIVIEGCANYGTVTSNNKQVEYVGGIIGVTNGQVASGQDPKNNIILIKDCTNHGNVVLGWTTAYDSTLSHYVAGIAGCFCSAKLEGCVNLGNITSNQHDNLGIAGIAGIYVKSVGSEIKNCINGESGSAATKGILTTNDSNSWIGGILAVIDSKTSGQLDITGSKNYANITTANSYVKHIGGLGGSWAAGSCVLNISDCENFGDVSNTSSIEGKGENKVGGFVGYLANADGKRTTFTNCTNHGDVTTTKTLKSSTQIGGFAANANYTDFTNCSNEGNVTFSNPTTLAPTNAVNIGGIVGYGSNDVNYTNCTNSGKVEIGTSTGTGNGLAGGIVGNNVGGSINNCENSGTVCVLEGYSGPAYVGGIIGIFSTSKIVIDGSKNTGTVYAKKTRGPFLIGGILGDGAALAAEVKNCVNEGNVYAEQNDYLAQTDKIKQYLTVGGIVGRSRGKSGALHEITGCTNRGTVTVTANTDNQLCNAGGIVGETNAYSTVTGCINEASGVVSCTNTVASGKTTRTAYAGGISGGDNEGTAGAAGNDTVTGNTNYANVTATVSNGATAIGAGGVFGMLRRQGTFTGNKVYGTAQISASGTDTVGGAGAILGYWANSNVTNLTDQKVKKTVVVNGTAWTAEAGTTWLCPTTGHPVTATYID